jgi:hypothetical protein
MSVTASSGSPSPQPACVGQAITCTLSASVSNPPTIPPSSPCILEGPYWSWSVKSTQYRASASDDWADSSGSVSINQPDVSDPAATMTATFGTGGYWKVVATATVNYNDTCDNTWTASGDTTVYMTVISVSLSPDPLYVWKGKTRTLTATVTPSDQGSSVTFDTADSSIATVAGSPPSLTVTGVGTGTTQVRATVSGTVCATSDVTSVNVTYMPDPVYVYEGKTYLWQAVVDPTSAQDQVTFDTADSTIATVDGMAPDPPVSGVATGTTTARAWLDSVQGPTATINVVKVVFSPDPLYVAKLDNQPLTATVTPAAAIGQVTFDTADATIATVAGTAPSLTVTGVEAGTTQVQAHLNNEVVNTSSVTVFKVEITDSGGTVLPPPPGLTATENVGIQTSLGSKLTPAGLAGITYLWTVGGSNIKTYKHDVDEAAKHVPIALAAGDLTNATIKYFWKDVGNPIAVKCKVTKGTSSYEYTANFNVTQVADPNKDIYTTKGARTTPNDTTGQYDVLLSHNNWHAGSPGNKMDNGDTPVYSATQGGGADTWGDNGGTFDTGYNGQAFLKWHRAFIDAHLAWRTEFNVGAIGGAAPGAPAVPEYLKASPAVNDAEKSNCYEYVRLGEFQNLYELGRGVVDPWHNTGHGDIATACGDATMATFDSPHTISNIFWRWHTQVDTMAVATDKASIILLTPADGSKPAAKPTSIVVVFDKRVSNGAPAANTIQIAPGKLKVAGSAATAIADGGGTTSKYMVFEFSGFAAPAAGAVTVELTGTNSYSGKTWTFTSP